MTTIAFTVKLRIPPTASVRDCEDYIRQAVKEWRGQCRPPGGYGNDAPEDPGDPMFGLDEGTVTVRAKR